MAKRINSSRLTPKLEKQEMDDVFIAFYELVEIHKNKDHHTQNYIAIRLVTVIEQFFRKIIEKQIKDGNRENIPAEIILKTSDFINLQQIDKELLIASSYPLQNINEIRDTMKQYNVINPFSDAEILKSFRELFSLRHDTVHTVISVNEEVVKYHTLVECMLKQVFDSVYGGEKYFYLSKGRALFELEKCNDAIKCYDKIIALKPDDVDAYYNKGITLVDLGHREKAIVCFDRVLELNSDYVGAYIYKGIILAELRQYAESIQCFDKAIELKPDSYVVYNNKGTTLAKLGQYTEAIQYFDKAIELKPDSYVVYNNKGDAFADLGRSSDAKKCHDKAKELKFDGANNSK